MINPPKLEQLTYGTKLHCGLGTSTVIADFDFETYSSAGFDWDPSANKWVALPNAKTKGLPTVGTARYTEHFDAEVLSMAYDLKNGNGPKLWTPNNKPPQDLFDHLAKGLMLEAWNAPFECWVWTNICVPKYGWPPLPINQLRCAAAKSRAFALPSSLVNAGDVLNISAKKDKDGVRLLNKFSMPRNPTKDNPSLRTHLRDDVTDANLLFKYNLQDIKAEAELSSKIPDLSPFEQELWYCDLTINRRGVAIDLVSIKNSISIIEQAYQKYNTELFQLTNGEVSRASEVAKLIKWINSQPYVSPITTLDSDVVDQLLKQQLPLDVKKVLEIRQIIGSAAVKKLYAMANQVTKDGRLHDLFVYHSARTGRAAGSGPQPQNLPNGGPKVVQCGNPNCKKHMADPGFVDPWYCTWCGQSMYSNDAHSTEWNMNAVEDALTCINTGSLECVELFFGNPIATISGCLRSLFIASPDHDLICSDYSAIEAVVLAELAGESWRQEVFRTHGKIYEMSASKITGTPFDEFEKHKLQTGQHHPMRKKVGKVAELASGYQGWIGAWKAFGASEFFTDDEMKEAILAWRKASPAIVEFWGGQFRYGKPTMYGIEGMAVLAIMNPGHTLSYRGIEFICKDDILYCKLLSGRYLTYHRPKLTKSDARNGLQISFEGWNTNPNNGPIGWIRMYTYGGKLTENIVQATARDILAYAIVNLEKAGYPVVLHVHDEIGSEVATNFGSIQEFEKILSTMPEWAKDWPVKASGGWRGKRYRK